MKHEVFKSELEYITNKNVKDFTIKALESLPNYFYEVPASSTGKYHPQYALGQGGLVRHTKAAVKIALELFNNNIIQNFNYAEKDIIISALLLHDGCKHGTNGSKYTIATHPLEIVKYIEENIKINKYLRKIEWDILKGCIESHMGEWNKDYKTKEEILPLPKTEMQKFVHLCDYLASRKIIEIKFE